ncbi:hypothetical protein BJ123_102122 [Rhodopseudomonas thermotolerans]|uniref:Uncharacterized protein n=2 Tax=Rhodopseudomonas TaxID=1073 RepID=A0A336JTA6_9BRAD|nr:MULTISPECIES: hypothetical protein [Rhodopseudomonas]RED41951.1 hypothetical protein BJ125_102120 [Rhodopseudomonas pentothenatexigens]REG07412.1 hypothetical protein BJ123_102122 [Rhodopseudomonas thermotolerans]SSW89311.1 hypothetical protein SAMN05892882_102120 [Rhodopseudomonas pentothenatexigens]
MERFVRNENIKRYRDLLKTEIDPDKRRVIQKLLAEEEAKELASER